MLFLYGGFFVHINLAILLKCRCMLGLQVSELGSKFLLLFLSSLKLHYLLAPQDFPLASKFMVFVLDGYNNSVTVFLYRVVFCSESLILFDHLVDMFQRCGVEDQFLFVVFINKFTSLHCCGVVSL